MTPEVPPMPNQEEAVERIPDEAVDAALAELIDAMKPSPAEESFYVREALQAAYPALRSQIEGEMEMALRRAEPPDYTDADFEASTSPAAAYLAGFYDAKRDSLLALSFSSFLPDNTQEESDE